MGVELRTIQRKFHSLMGEVKPSVRPRFVVWLDERLAEFKIKGEMDLSETLDDPQWLKSYYSSKRQAKTAAILKRETRNAGSSDGGSIQPKVEAQSESSNGVAHPTESEWVENKPHIQSTEAHDVGQNLLKEPFQPTEESDFQLVEVKQEQLEEEDDDMIIIGETIAPPVSQTFSSQSRQINPGYGRNQFAYQRKRQRFGTFPSRQNIHSGGHFKSRMKHTTRTSGLHQTNKPYPSHTVTSQSAYPTESLSQPYQPEPIVFPGASSHLYDTSGHSTSFDKSLTLGANESLRIPSHLQAQASELNLSGGSYGGDEGDMYLEYSDESYDASYVTDPAETSLRFDEDGNAVIRGEQQSDDITTDPHPGTSDGTTSQDIPYSHYYGRQFTRCPYCGKGFSTVANMRRHMNFVHLSLQRYKCNVCARSFQEAGTLRYHMLSVHLKEKPFACPCGASFYLNSKLKKHYLKCQQS